MCTLSMNSSYTPYHEQKLAFIWFLGGIFPCMFSLIACYSYEQVLAASSKVQSSLRELLATISNIGQSCQTSMQHPILSCLKDSFEYVASAEICIYR